MIAVIVIASCIIALVAIFALLYYIALPKFLVNKIRSGEEVLSYPDNFYDTLSKLNVTNSLEYTSKFPSNTFDIYRPIDNPDAPILIWVHGGFFIAGDKSGVENVCASIAARGYTVIAMNYALAPEQKHPTAILQLDELITHIKLKHTDLNISQIALAGDSAGGYIVAQYCAMISSVNMQSEANIHLNNTKDDIKACVLTCAPIDISLIRGINPKLDKLLPVFGRAYFGKGKWYNSEKFNHTKTIDYVTSEFPPSFLTDGNHISFEPQNRCLGEKLRSVGVDCEEIYFNINDGNVEHEYLFKLRDDNAVLALDRICKFLDRYLA